MKFLVVSDIHGCATSAKKALEIFESCGADRLLLLGDYLYHGPRNPLPLDYDPKTVASLLNRVKEKVIAVRGNCDGEVDQMMIEFPILSDYALIFNEGREIFATHGHVYNFENKPVLPQNSVFIFGHVHLPIAKKEDGIYCLNPGSITLPKQDNPNSYGILDENGFTIYNLNQEVIKSIQFE